MKQIQNNFLTYKFKTWLRMITYDYLKKLAIIFLIIILVILIKIQMNYLFISM